MYTVTVNGQNEQVKWKQHQQTFLRSFQDPFLLYKTCLVQLQLMLFSYNPALSDLWVYAANVHQWNIFQIAHVLNGSPFPLQDGRPQ